MKTKSIEALIHFRIAVCSASLSPMPAMSAETLRRWTAQSESARRRSPRMSRISEGPVCYTIVAPNLLVEQGTHPRTVLAACPSSTDNASGLVDGAWGQAGGSQLSSSSSACWYPCPRMGITNPMSYLSPPAGPQQGETPHGSADLPRCFQASGNHGS